MPETVIKGYIEELDMNLIDISDENVRKTKGGVGLEDLKASIANIGLIQPVIVAKSGDRYKLIVGQRRFLAFRELGKPTIPALLVGRLDPKTRMMLSFGENMHRKRLPFNDTVEVCDFLFGEKAGSNIDKIREIAEDLGIDESTVKRYLGYRLIPKRVRDMVDGGKLPAEIAARIASGWFPNERKIIEIAEYATTLTPPERVRLLEIGAKKPDESVMQLVEDAKKRPEAVELTVFISPELYGQYQTEAKERKVDIKELAVEALENYIKGGD